MSQPTAELRVGDRTYRYHPVPHGLPRTIAILAENLIRRGGDQVQIGALLNWVPCNPPDQAIEFAPARVVMQDFTGVPAVVDLAVMREAVAGLGGDPALVNPRVPTELVIDHSVVADRYGTPDAFAYNVDREFERNAERYQFLKWGQQAFTNFRVVPPGTGIVHQVNIEHLARVVMTDGDLAYPDTCVGTDSHTTMVNGLGVLGWGVGGIEAEAAMLGQPVSLAMPRVVGVELTGRLVPGVTATDLVLAIAERLRLWGVVGAFVEFFGPALPGLGVETRATIANMSPEYGSTACLFPVDEQTLAYLALTGRSAEQCELVEAYAKAQGWWGPAETAYSEILTIDIGAVRPSVAGPSRPQDRLDLANARAPEKVVIAAITSCTNTSNPRVMIGAGLLAKAAALAGLTVPAWVKTTLSPGSQVVTDYLDRAGLTPYLERLGFYLTGYGCMTCIGNAGPLNDAARTAVEAGARVAAVLSGNRNFEGRIHADVWANYLASPPLVVAYALAGTMDIDLTADPLGHGPDGRPVYLADLWPTEAAIDAALAGAVTPAMFAQRYASVFTGTPRWAALTAPAPERYDWPDSTYIARPPFVDGLAPEPPGLRDVIGARILVMLGDSVTTDHISPAGSIKPGSPAAAYLDARGVAPADYNSYGSRRGHHAVMQRGTFANVRLRNLMIPGVEGGYTKDWTRPDAPVVPIPEAAAAYARAGTPLVVVAGQEYGSGSSRDWAAKGPALLGVRAVIAESYERIHRSNLIGLGILPLQFADGESRATWGLTGSETITITGLRGASWPREAEVSVDGVVHTVVVRVDTPAEATYLAHGGILPYQVRVLAGLA